jgi:TPR repeat protein
MSAPVREPDDGPSKDGPSQDGPSQDGPLNYAPKKVRDPEQDQKTAGAPEKGNAALRNAAPELAEPPWRRSKQRQAFAGDVAISELRSRLALAPDRLPEPPPPLSTGPKSRWAGRLAGVAVVAAVGVAGYKSGSAPPTSTPQLALPSSQPNQRGRAPERSVPAVYLDNAGLDSKSPAGRPSASGLSTGMAVDSARGVSSAATTGPQSAEPAFASPAAAKAMAPQFNEQKAPDATSLRAVSRQLTVGAVQPQQADEPARLTISAADAGANAAVVIGGLAPGSALSAGTGAGPNTWRLSVEELAGATITPPRGFVGTMDLTLELRLADNAVADRKGLQLEWSGKSALAPAKSQPRRIAASEIALMVKNGAQFMANGNVGAARMMLQPAAESGDPVAAFALAETYDPLVLRKLNATGGITADVALAQSWYEKAKNLGSAGAPERLERLARLPE